MSFEYVFILAVSLFSAIAVALSVLVLIRTKKRNDSFIRSAGNTISPQREQVENMVYNNSMILTQDLGYLTDTNHILIDTSANNEMTFHKTLPDFSFFENMGIDLRKVQVDDKMVMCLMPFNRKFDKTKYIIAEACESMGYRFCRSDDELIENNTDLRKSIISMILEARVIIAVLDGRNPNVFYEIGVAHSMGKLVLLVANLSREENKWREVDLLSNRLITYNNPNELKTKLTKTLEAIHDDERRE